MFLLILGAACAPFAARGPAPSPEPIASRVLGADSAAVQTWIERQREETPAGPFRARVRLRLQAEGQPARNLNGTLSASLPDTLWLSASLGPFQPVFALLAGADSCLALFHRERVYWVVSRADPDWDAMDPAAWAEVLDWALSPRDLLLRLSRDGPIRRLGKLYWIEGTLSALPLRIAVGLEPKTGRVREFRVTREGVPLLSGALDRFHRVAGGEVATVMRVSFPQLGFGLRAELNAIRAQHDLDLGREWGRPPGWTAAGPGFSFLPPVGAGGD